MENLIDVTEYLKEKYKLNNGFFCIYGSYATNTQNNKSDLDLLYIHRKYESNLRRISEIYNNLNISFYELSIKDLFEDANGKYGGFFCGKIFNPHKLIGNSEKDNLIIEQAMALFFAKLFNKKHCNLDYKYTKDEILKNSIRIYIDLYPDYFSYIVRLFATKNFDIIWKKWVSNHISFLTNQKIIEFCDNKYTYLKIISIDEFELTKIDYISRFWIYGAISHNSNIEFYDYYRDKNRKYVTNNINFKKKAEEFLGLKYKIGGEVK